MPVTLDDTDTRIRSLSTPLKQPSEPVLMSAFKRSQSNQTRPSMTSMLGSKSALHHPRVRSVSVTTVRLLYKN